MNRQLRCCIVAASAFGLAACASQGHPGYAASAAGSAGAKFTQDAEYTAAVERTARIRGVDVHWVNPPQKRVSVASADDNGSE